MLVCDKCGHVGTSSADFGYNRTTETGWRGGGFQCGKCPEGPDDTYWCGGHVRLVTSSEELEALAATVL